MSPFHCSDGGGCHCTTIDVDDRALATTPVGAEAGGC